MEKILPAFNYLDLENLRLTQLFMAVWLIIEKIGLN
jgi:hypothetical protein